MSKHALPGGEHDIRRYEAAGIGVVVSTLQVVPARFVVVDIAAVAEGLILTEGACQRAGGGENFSPGIVGIFYHRLTILVNQLYYISLGIAQIIVICSVIRYGYYAAVGVIAESLRYTSRGHAHQKTAVIVVIRGYSIDRLLRAQSIFIIYIG